MQLTRLAGNCPGRSTCPTIYATDRGTVVVQGYTLLPTEVSQIGLPAGESAVEIPASLLEEAARVRRG
jgi:hypothetical protein